MPATRYMPLGFYGIINLKIPSTRFRLDWAANTRCVTDAKTNLLGSIAAHFFQPAHQCSQEASHSLSEATRVGGGPWDRVFWVCAVCIES